MFNKTSAPAPCQPLTAARGAQKPNVVAYTEGSPSLPRLFSVPRSLMLLTPKTPFPGLPTSFRGALVLAAARAVIAGAAASGLSVFAADPPGPAASGWVVSQDGSLVIDAQAQLAWPRCVEGMQWTGKACSGKPLLLDRAEATALAAQRWQAEGVAWRLPRVAELQRLTSKAGKPQAGAGVSLFPPAPDLWYWAATANVAPLRGSNPYNYNTIRQAREGDSATQMAMINGWAVNLATGEARGDVARASKLPVRLVRPYTPQ